MKKIISAILRGLKAYLCNWRNLLGHALLGVLFVAAAIWVPVPWWVKLIVIACLIAFNIVRMRLSAKKKRDGAQDKAPQADIVREGEN